MRGHVRKHQGKWAVVVDLEPVNGKRKQKWFMFDSEKEAHKGLPKILIQLDNNMYTDPEKTTLNEFIKEWFETKKKMIRQTSIRGYDTIIRNYIEPNIGNMKLRDIKTIHIQKMYNKLLDSVSIKTVRNTHAVIHTVFKSAIRQGMLSVNPSDMVELPKNKRVEIKVLNPEEMKTLLEYVKDTVLFVPLLLAITTGMRAGELTGLEYNHIDMERGIINVKQARNRFGVTELKTDKSRRQIALSDDIVQALKNEKEKQKDYQTKICEYQTNDYICKHEDGTPFHFHYLYKKLQWICNKGIIPKIRLHDLRHSHATLLVSKGVSLKIIQDRLGHSTIRTTADIYSHPDIQVQIDAIKGII